MGLLPLTLTLEDYASTEKISDLPKRLSTQGAPAGIDPSVGDVTYYAPWRPRGWRTTRLVVGDELVRARAEADERQVVAGQDENVLGQPLFKLLERTQIETERVAVRVHRFDADVGRDLRQDLVAAGNDRLWSSPRIRARES